MKFQAVAFDLDGTLYPNFRLYLRLVPFLVKEQRLLRAMNNARMYLRNSGDYKGNFYDNQARIAAEILHETPEKTRDRIEQLIYRGWEPYFKKIRLFPYVKDTLDSFRKAGIRMGLLSDFPPEKKLVNLEISGYWDAVACSEVSGRLKPDPAPFLDLAGKMGMKAEDILYVGNSVSYDVKGASKAGMKTALIRSRFRKRLSLPDFSFYDYRQLRDYVLS